MFEKGDYIVYGCNGVCRVDGVTKLNLPGVDKDRLYYVLIPVKSQNSRMYSPTDNSKVVLRKVISKDEAIKLIDDIPNIECITIEDEKQKEVLYRDAIKSCDCRELVRIIKTLYVKKQKRLSEGKKTTAIDEKYFDMAEDNLYSELAVSMGKEKAGIESFIAERIGK